MTMRARVALIGLLALAASVAVLGWPFSFPDALPDPNAKEFKPNHGPDMTAVMDEASGPPSRQPAASDEHPDAIKSRPTSAGASREILAADSPAAKKVIYTAQSEQTHFRAELEKAEQRAGESPSAYLYCLELQLEFQMRVEAVQSLESGRALLVPAGRNEQFFGSTPYILYSTREKIRGFPAAAAVPMSSDGLVASMQKAVSAERSRIIADYVEAHNAKADAERFSVYSSWKSGKGLTGLAKFVEDMVGHRLVWRPDNFLALKK
jgi:hypothetical protein